MLRSLVGSEMCIRDSNITNCNRLNMAGKNLHLEHLEDEIINNGISGGRASINFLRELRDMMKGNASGRVNMTVKWDGAPAIWCGPHPETGDFFVAKKSLFNKTEALYYSSVKEINDSSDLNGTLKSKFVEAFNAFSGIGMDEILQGDLMFTDGEKKSNVKMDGKTYITFQPNTILYACLLYTSPSPRDS